MFGPFAFIALRFASPLPHAELPPQPPAAPDVAVIDVGITVETLAASGAGVDGVSSVSASLDEMAQELSTLVAAELAASATAIACSAAVNSAWVGGDVEEYAALLIAFAEQTATLQAARADVHSEAVAGLPADVQGRLNNLWINLPRRVPMEFRVLSGDDDWWETVEGALLAERRAIRFEEPVPDDVAAILESVRTHPEVVAAQAALNADVLAIEAAMQQIASPPM